MYMNDRLCSPMISMFPTFLSTIIYLGGDRMTIRHPKNLFAQCGNTLNWDLNIIAVTLNSNHLSFCWQAVISGLALEETPLETSYVDLLWCWIQKNAQIQSEISSPR